MISWIHVFSDFTTEALLIEAAIICFLICAYAAFWILRKRKYGSIDSELPSGPVKAYLNELIVNAEQLRTQLFGLLASKDVPHGHTLPNILHAASPSADTQKQLEILQRKIEDQNEQIRTLMNQKGAPAEAAPAGANPADSEKLKQLEAKAAELESKLKEYSVIEDDLANLTRLNRENAELKAALAKQGGSPPSTGAAASDANSEASPEAATDPKVEEVVNALSKDASPSTPSAAEEPASANPEKEAPQTPEAQTAAPAEPAPPQEAQPPAPAAPIQEKAPTPATSGETKPAEPDAQKPVPPPTGATSAASPKATPQSAAIPDTTGAAPQDDLVEEFEKMLKG